LEEYEYYFISKPDATKDRESILEAQEHDVWNDRYFKVSSADIVAVMATFKT